MTGAGTGYGRCIALALAAASAQVFITGRRAEKLEQTRAEALALDIEPVRVVAVAADITNERDVARAIEVIGTRVPQLHGLIKNAALPLASSSASPLADLTLAQWSALLTTNATTQWMVSKAALPLLKKTKVYGWFS